MSAQPAPARQCRCQHPLLDGDTCLRCGRSTSVRPDEPLFGSLRSRTRWTRRGVVRTFRAFAFFRGRAPVRADWRPGMGTDWPALETVEELFGSLEAATLAAGFDYAS